MALCGAHGSVRCAWLCVVCRWLCVVGAHLAARLARMVAERSSPASLRGAMQARLVSKEVSKYTCVGQ